MSDYIFYKTHQGDLDKLSIFYNNFVMPVKNRLDEALEFLDVCLDEHFKSLRSQTKKPDLAALEKVKHYKQQLRQFERIDFPRFEEYKAKQKRFKEYLPSMQKFVEKNKARLTGLTYLFSEYDTSFVKQRIIYKYDSELFRKIDFARSIFKENRQPPPEQVKAAIFRIVEEKHELSGKLYQTMVIFVELMQLTFESSTSLLRTKFHEKLKNRYFEFVTDETLRVDHFYDLGKEDPAKEHVQIADQQRKSPFFRDFLTFNQLGVENVTLFQKPEWNPFFFSETYEKRVEPESVKITGSALMNLVRSTIKKNVRMGNLYSSRILTQKKQHLVILVHGYHASHFDMRVYQNFLAKIIPHSIFLISKANENMTKKRIEQMGVDLAEEIKAHIRDSKSHFSKISFIGHSLGGVIIRAALGHLTQYKNFFFTFVSLSSPHLGCRQNKSSLVNIGMAFMDKVQKDIVISQLNMNDHEDPTQTFLYKLAQTDRLNHFNNVILVSSPQDHYVPYTSARIQPLQPKDDDQFDNAIFRMAQNIWNLINNDMIVRLDVDLRSEKK